MSKSGRESFRLGAESYSSLGRVGKKEKIACPLLDVFACGQVSSPRLYRLRDNQIRSFPITHSFVPLFLTANFDRRYTIFGLVKSCSD